MAGFIDDNHERAFEEALEQFVDSHLWGKEHDVDEFVRQYPEFEHQIRKRIRKIQRIDALFDSLVRADESDFEGSVAEDSLVGHKIGSFEVIEMIGRGGMGVVYLANDTKLKRPVAIKSMPAALSGDSTARTRFRREAELLASLNHPNIAVIHDIIEKDEGAGYLILEYVHGQTLAEHIASGRLELEETLSISEQIAEAIVVAHEHGIIHRDLKPGNIKITPHGNVKVLDFGLAKVVDDKVLDQQTAVIQPARLIGTPAYMSPEQIKCGPVDYRTDIWSLGVIMYEMIAGELPFNGDNLQAITHSILYEKPEYLRDFREGLPIILEQILTKTMEKEPQQRYQNMTAVLNELKSIRRDAISYSSSYQRSPSIAVLPFMNMSADKEQEYFCDGIAEELINALTQIRDLRVIARTSAFSYKGKNVKIRDIGRELNVETVLEGSVRRAGNRLRITAQLVDKTCGYQLWSERYDRDMGNIFAIQDEITCAIVENLKPRLLGKEEARLTKRKDVKIEAYQSYLRGRFFLNKRVGGDIRKAIDYFNQAKEQDGNYALTHAGLALSYTTLPMYSPVTPKQVLPKAREALQSALQLDETLPDAHASLGLIKTWFDWDWVGAEEEFKQALEYNPGYASAHQWYSYSLLFTARFSDALREMEQALELDPVSVAINRDLGAACYYAGQFERAIEISKTTLEMDPSIMFGRYHMGFAYLKTSKYEEALKAFQKEKEIERGVGLAEPAIAFTYVQMGRKAEAKKVLDNVRKQSGQKYLSPFNLACLHFVLDKNDEGFELLDRAYDEQDQWLSMLKALPVLDSIRPDPRYTQMLKKMNFED
jgi:serine/threonine-protein kinase